MEERDTAIRAENIGKRYKLGMTHHDRLADAALAAVGAATRAFSRRARRAMAAPWMEREKAEAGRAPQRNDGAEPTDHIWALRHIDFEVRRGEVLGVIGRNGAGKSTLLKVLSRITEPTEGRAFLRGRVSSLLEVGTGFHPELTGRENVYLNGAILGMTRREIRERYDDIVAFAEIGRFMDTPTKRYSSGMRVRLAFAVAAHLQPEIMLIDEVLAVGDTGFQKKCLGKMGDVTRGGRTIVFVSHNMSAIAQLTERCLVLDAGQTSFLGPTDEAIQHYLRGQSVERSDGRAQIEALPCEKRVTMDPKVRFVELGLAAGQAGEINVGDDLRVQALVESRIALDAAAFGYTIRDEFGGAVLSGHSPPFRIPGPGRHLRELVIQELPLAPGSYELCMSIQTGGLTETKYTYDSVFGFGRFSVGTFFDDLTPLGDWRRGWGRIVHRKAEVVEVDGETPEPPEESAG